MRGIATFFIIISIIGVLGALVWLGSGEYAGSSDELWGQFVVLIGMLFASIGAWHGSRVSALFLILLLLVSPLSAIMGYAELGVIDWLRAGLYIALSAAMLLSAFRYHAVSRTSNLTLRGVPWLRWVGKLLSGAVVAVCGFGVLVLTFGQSTMLIKGSEISESQWGWLSENGFLEEGERPIYLYFDGLFSPEQGGTLLTNKYVGSWWQEDNGLQAYWIELGQVCDVKTISEGNLASNAVYQVHGPGEDNWVQIWLSVEDNRHKDFISRMKTINDRKMRPEIQHFCDENRAIDWGEVAEMNGISESFVAEADVSDSQRAWLIERKFLLESEAILSFYSSGKFSISEGGNLLTDEYFGGWYEANGEVESWWVKIGEICSLTPPAPTDERTSAFYRLTGVNDSWIELKMPARTDEVDVLVERVLTMNSERETDEHRATCGLS